MTLSLESLIKSRLFDLEVMNTLESKEPIKIINRMFSDRQFGYLVLFDFHMSLFFSLRSLYLKVARR